MKQIKLNYSAGDNAVLSCDATGKPHPVITWFFRRLPYKGRSKMPGSERPGPYQYKLSLKAIDVGEAGEYCCKVQNSYGVRNFTFKINVKRKWPFPVHPDQRKQSHEQMSKQNSVCADTACSI